MHGRLKIRTSAEEAIRKKKEHEIKVKMYRAAMSKIFAKREVPNAELFELTSKLLLLNPDLATLWNIRRECILASQKGRKDDAVIFDRDLDFTEQCLRVQPKSYSAWHHRCWILENCPVPNWDKELELCAKYLKMDERNFHGWDYRRYIAAKANVPPEKELDFCTQKIEANFSNYSSWHYRSKLLPQLYPNTTDVSKPISDDQLKKELDLVLSATFTEPNDSSAWFYQRWLLGYSESDFDVVAFKLTESKAIVAFSKGVNPNKEGKFAGCALSDELNAGQWKSATGEAFDTVWFFEKSLNFDSTADFELEFKSNDSLNYTLRVCRLKDGLLGVKVPKFGYDFSVFVTDELKRQLKDCNELLDIDPDCKWTLLTAALLMRSIDRRNPDFHALSMQHLEKLQQIDPLRVGYYKDLASKWRIERALETWIARGNPKAPLDLSNLDLTSLHYEQFMSIVEEINLAGNRLAARTIPRMNAFQSCRELNMGRNLLETWEGFHYAGRLRKLGLEGNPLGEGMVERLQEQFTDLEIM